MMLEEEGSIRGVEIDEANQLTNQLTNGCAELIDTDQYELQGQEQRRIRMQVVDLAKLKYPTSFDVRNGYLEANNLDGAGVSSVLQYTRPFQPFMTCAPYRLLLSDGRFLAPAKFYPERHNHSFRGRELLKIHNLVSSGELQKGTIIEFTPNSHTESGNGIVTIFQLDIVSQSPTVIINQDALQPIHDGALAFSPSNEHNCTVKLDDEKDDPLPLPVLQLAKALEEKAYGYCAIAGGACLAKYLLDLPGCHCCYSTRYSPAIAKVCDNLQSLDVDMFIPLEAGKLNTFYGVDEEEQQPRRTLYSDEVLYEALKSIYCKYGTQHTELKTEKIRLSGIEEGGQDYGWMRIFVGLKEKIEFQLITCTGQIIDKPVQILVMDALPQSRDESWSDVITRGFDADIIQCSAVLGDDARVKEIKFHNNNDNDRGHRDNAVEQESTCQGVVTGEFHYTMRPCHTFPRMLERLNKYKARGFELGSFSFDSRVSDEWREYILSQFRQKYFFKWMDEFVKEANNIHLPDEIVRDKILSFLEDRRPEEEQHRDTREMLRNMIRTELHRTGGRDPGGNQVRLEMMEDEWRRADRLALGLDPRSEEEIAIDALQEDFFGEGNMDAE